MAKGRTAPQAPPPRRPQAKSHTEKTNGTGQPFAKVSTGMLFLLLLPLVASLASVSSQLSLSPVFGATPSSLSHDALRASCFVLAWAAAALPLKPAGLRFADRAVLLLPWISLATSSAERHIWLGSARLGSRWGPLVCELATFAPVYFLSTLAVAAKVSAAVRSLPIACLAGTVMWVASSGAEKFVQATADQLVGSGWLVTRCGLRAATGLAGGVAALPSLSALPALAGIIASALYFNPTCGTSLDLVNSNLAQLNYTMLARSDSITGYISVLENTNTERRFRILRCDHSILGGEWRGPKSDDPETLNEPVYPVFVMLEAVRLVNPPATHREKPEALLIGLGIGTAAGGLIKSDVKTTLVELDPVVYEYAREYFKLPADHTSHLTDAVDFVNKAAEAVPVKKKYDYIVHDVFTGGAVPADLFTSEFLLNLKSLLKNDGVVAINYAGDMKLKAARMVLKTIVSVFKNCRAFREDDPSSHSDESKTVDFTNMVIFCVPFHERRVGEAIPYFHPPQEADYHDTFMRRGYLMPKFEIDLLEALRGRRNDDDGDEKAMLTKANVGMVRNWQKESAMNHWTIMNTVVPIEVWVNY